MMPYHSHGGADVIHRLTEKTQSMPERIHAVMRAKSGLAFCAALSALALGVTGCSSGTSSHSGSSSSSAGGAGSTSAGGASSAGSAGTGGSSIDQIYTQAKSEGKVTWYTSLPQAEGDKIVAAFEKAYSGITVTAVYLSGNTPTTRIETEAKGGLHNADVVSGGNDAILLQQAGFVDQSWDAPDAPPPTQGVDLPKGIYVDQVQTNVISYNPTALKAAGLPVPTGWADFAKPEWKGKFSIDPVTADIVDALGPSEGYDTVLSLMKQIGANSPVFVTSHSLSSSQVASGTVIAALSTYGYKAITYKKKDPSTTDFVNPNPLPVGISEIAIVKGAPHLAAARLFQDWFVSKAGQQACISLGLVSIRTDAGNDPTLWDPSKWKPAFVNANDTTEHVNQILSEYRAALGYKGK